MNIGRKTVVVLGVVSLFCAAIIGIIVRYGTVNSAEINEHQVQVGTFGTVHMFSVAQADKGHLIVFAAGGESVQVRRDLARRWAGKGYVTSVIDPGFLSLNSSCIDLVGPIKHLQHVVGQRFPALKDLLPLVLGRGEGAALSYIALAQAPVKTFHSAVAMDFCPSKPLPQFFCEHRAWASPQGVMNAPTQSLGASVYVFQTPLLAQSNACDMQVSNQFLGGIASVKLSLTRAPDDWSEVDALLNWLDPRLSGQALSSQNADDSPVIEVPAKEGKNSDYFVLFLTGDGGWAQLDKELAQHFSESGAPVVGFDSLSYFWRKRSVEETASEISKLISRYEEKWQKKQVVLLGYSFGADVLPSVIAKLPKEQQGLIKEMVFLGLSRYAHFEFYLTNWLSSETRESPYSTLEALKTISDIPGLCVQGAEDEESICKNVQQTNIKSISLPGDHHYGEDYDALAQVILRALDSPVQPVKQ